MNRMILYFCLLGQLFGSTDSLSQDFYIGKKISVSNNLKILHSWEIQEVLGQGEYGCVYKVYDSISKEIYAMKVQCNDLIESLQMEKSIYENFSSEYLLKYYGTYTYKNWTILLLEYCSTTLEDFLKSSVKYIVKVGLIKNVIFALRFLHDNRIIHNDLKANNIMVTNNLKCKIFDFGISCYETATKHIFYNLVDGRNPCYSYISPEVRARVVGYNCNSDIWSLGALVNNIFLNVSSNISMMNFNTNNTPGNFLYSMLNTRSYDRPSSDLLIYHEFFDPLYGFLDYLIDLKNFYIYLPDNIMFIKKDNYFEIKYKNLSISLLHFSTIYAKKTIDDGIQKLTVKKYTTLVQNSYKPRFLFSKYRFYMISTDRKYYFSIVELDFYVLDLLENIVNYCRDKVLGFKSKNSFNYKNFVENLFQAIQETKYLNNINRKSTLCFKYRKEKENWKNIKSESIARETHLRNRKFSSMTQINSGGVPYANQSANIGISHVYAPVNRTANIPDSALHNEELQNFSENYAKSRSSRAKRRSGFFSLCVTR
ncbi:protein kinase [Hamiltosporidium magnivora]|uniref:non-specific serine/threonine protein kinase n=1 Tax=Hamiltosporidium magnivora TaxID=148818 RepID=A0A4Q9LHD7_9MICR|nr:protein kinase [Hamiltosporidium magnivora]